MILSGDFAEMQKKRIDFKRLKIIVISAFHNDLRGGLNIKKIHKHTALIFLYI